MACGRNKEDAVRPHKTLPAKTVPDCKDACDGVNDDDLVFRVLGTPDSVLLEYII